MRFLTYFLSIFVLSAQVSAQQVNFSLFTEEQRAKANEFALEVLNKIASNNFTDFDELSGDKETNLNNTVYLKNKDFVTIVKTMAGNKQLALNTYKLYSFDDILNSNKRTDVGNNLHNIFTNLNMLAEVNYSEQGKTYKMSLIIGSYETGWKISGIHFSNLKLNNDTTAENENYRTEPIENCNFELQLPNYFERKENNKGMANFVFAAQTERDAIIQVMCNELSASADYLSYKWVERLTTQKYKTDRVIVRLFPLGLAFEYTITDPTGNASKGKRTVSKKIIKHL